ncbi:Elongation factor Ts [Candidatus Trichorickettsia mobilis]|uniref:Elongation factor Ts n=1 Tax=Candidatus Trichorickettsia mobilis TaxID=1346319 RepID=A0ABZ0UVW2_9RICK|nr:translation elongation factor Ts [Candidatus Trichorickettsia mobilis]WPY01242.1 Elongation factor Ts [Candidatus Trichorickettsia mobilis]
MISASLVKDLREKTGAGMMDCKKALLETNGDFEAAIDWLRTKGLAAAAKKAERIAAEGLTAAIVVGNRGAVVEVNSETDFVARNEQFQHLVKSIGELAVQCDNFESLTAASMPSGKSVADEIIENISTIGENINLRRMNVVKVQDGVIASYVHNSVVEGLGKIAVIVGLESKAADKTKLKSLGKQIAMHIAALKPQALNQSDLDPALIQRERDIFFEQSRASGKPDNIIEKMIEGRIRKFFEEVVLVDQVFVIDGKLRISEVLANAAKDLGAELTIANFVRYEVGEGIEQEDKNFADEVAAVMK